MGYWPFAPQTLAVCILARGGALRRAMESVAAVADEFVVAGGGEDAKKVLAAFPKARHIETSDETDALRLCREQAAGAWILEIRDDERMGANFRARVGKLMRAWRWDAYELPVCDAVAESPLACSAESLRRRERRLYRNVPRVGEPRARFVEDCHVFRFIEGAAGPGVPCAEPLYEAAPPSGRTRT